MSQTMAPRPNGRGKIARSQLLSRTAGLQLRPMKSTGAPDKRAIRGKPPAIRCAGPRGFAGAHRAVFAAQDQWFKKGADYAQANAARLETLAAQIAGTVAARAEKKSAKGTRYAFVTLSDPTGLYEATVFSDVLDAHRALLEPGMNVLLTVNAEPSGDQVKMLARSVQSLEDAVADAGSGLLAVEVADPRTAVAVLDRLRETSAEMSVSAKGRGPLLMRVREGNTVYDVEVAPDVPVTPRMRQALRAVEGVIDVTEE